ncbi:MAG: type II toxin-antitoxin system PemK/MazF family toxin, partial [Candidatus Saccharimonadales bacterium]
MANSDEIRLGTIILAEVSDPATQQAVGPHFAVVLTRNAEIDAGVDLVVAVCTTSYSYPLKSGWFEMPSKPGGHELTGLSEACVAKATWLEVVPQAKVLKTKGRAPVSITKQILNWLRDRKRQR